MKKRLRIVLMAGGYGKRLQPLTRDTPKPMILIHGKPILEIIIERLKYLGFGKCQFYIAVGYLRAQIINYFGNGKAFGVNIEYLHEKENLGTAGGLGLLPKSDELTIVHNGDIISNYNINTLIANHVAKNADMSVCTYNYTHRIPYGVMCIKGDSKVTHLKEKPLMKYPVAAGIYVLEPHVIQKIPKNCYVDMPHIINTTENIHCFSMMEGTYWSDIADMDDLAAIKTLMR